MEEHSWHWFIYIFVLISIISQIQSSGATGCLSQSPPLCCALGCKPEGENCYCDEQCQHFGDCCQDYLYACKASTTVSPGNSTYSKSSSISTNLPNSNVVSTNSSNSNSVSTNSSNSNSVSTNSSNSNSVSTNSSNSNSVSTNSSNSNSVSTNSGNIAGSTSAPSQNSTSSSNNSVSANLTNISVTTQLTTLSSASTVSTQSMSPSSTINKIPAPGNITEISVVNVTTTSVFISWGAPPGNQISYRIQVTGPPSSSLTVTTPYVSLSGLNPGIAYTITVTPVAADNTTGNPVALSIFTKPAQVPILSVTSATTSSISLSWVAVQGSQITYRLQAVGPSNSSTTVSTTSATLSGLVSGSRYNISIIAVAADNVTSSDAASATAYTSK
ncbi:receptor-type tyrosine-protein phosphatase eta-like [Protopterus annectens]|uniref:receptor-type tyrosine-protein phosphatase eta-like n=1 Tax=Protopterus annectens TaxID=7888 RepID=UPI001CFB6825|nr:receptor-type tyrosine-protein phosphatase eta-like [Protopterus annectens]